MHESTTLPINPSQSGRIFALRVRNHPGAMSHITGLFSRRAFNLDAIVCVPNADDSGATSTMLLAVSDEPRLDQVYQHLRKLEDVIMVETRPGMPMSVFQDVLTAIQEGPRKDPSPS